MSEKLKILILEDVEADVGLVNHILKRNGLNFDLKRVDTRQEFTDAVAHYNPDVILSDHSLPQFNSIEALKIYHQFQLYVPFILVTGSVSEEFAVQCLKQGADDYILKSNLIRLPRAIENALRQRQHHVNQKKAEQELKTQYEALVKINQEMDSFVYSVSHNIRSPLASVMGLLNLVQREDENRDSFFQPYFGMMNQSVRKLDDTLKEILEYSRNARSEVGFEEVDIRSIIEESLDRLKYREGFEQVIQHTTIMQEHPLYSDPYRLGIIFSNLISNAIVYRDAGKKECKLNIHVLVQEEGSILTIEDNGIGIDPKYLPRVFDMFYRASLKSDGAGLGLYIVRETVHKLGGEIKIDSHLGLGTVCKVKLPHEKRQVS